MPYLFLILAVVAETIGTTALQASQQFTRLGPTLICLLAYGIGFWLLSYVLKFMPVGVVYAMWSGMGIIFIAIIGFAVFSQRLDVPAILGISLILGGIIVIQLFSGSSHH